LHYNNIRLSKFWKEEVKPTSYVVKNGVDFKLFAPHSKKKLFLSPDTIKKKGRIHWDLRFSFWYR
jgi:hypothetical protein